MFPLPKYMVVIASIGHGLLFSMALSAGVRMVCGLFGTPISPETANNVFGYSALIAMPLAGYFNIARVMLPIPREQPTKS